MTMENKNDRVRAVITDLSKLNMDTRSSYHEWPCQTRRVHMSELLESQENECFEEHDSDYPTIHEELADRGMSIHDFI